MAHVAATFPSVFVAPTLWQTDDGGMPHRALWAWFHMIDAIDARAQLTLTAATSIAYHGGEDGSAQLQDMAARVTPP